MSKLKLSYALSKQEFLLLMLLAVVALLALCLNYLIFPQWESYQESRQQYEQQEALVEKLRTEYAKLDVYREEEEALAGELGDMEAVLPTYLSQEEILTGLDDVAARSGLALPSIAFGGETTQDQGSFLASLQGNKSTGAPSGDSGSGGAVKSEEMVVNVSGSYGQLHKFLTDYEEQTRKVFFRSASLSRDSDGGLNGTLELLIFSVGTENEPVDYPGYPYDAPAPEGKEDPFAAFALANGGKTGAAEVSDTQDFYVILNTYDDNASKIYLGKYPASGVQLTSDENRNVQASLTLTQSGQTYRYTYTLGGRSRSGSFAPAEGQSALTVSVLSRERKNSDDKVGMTLSVKNETDLPVNVRVSNDDEQSPRFQLGTTSGSVKATG